MSKKASIPFLIAVMTLCLIISLPVSALAPTGKGFDIDDKETSFNGSVSMAAGKEKDLSGFIEYGVRSEKSGDQWYMIGTVSWASSNPDIVSVSGKGVATAHRVGVAKITATGWDNIGRKHVQIITVGVSGASSASAENSFEISEGVWLDLHRLGELHSGSKDIIWASSVPDIAEVDSAGLIKAHSTGRCTVTATYADGNNTQRVVKYRIRVTTGILSDQTRNSTIILHAGDEIDVGMLYYPNYQNLPLALGGLSCAIGNKDVLSVNGMTVRAKSSGSGSVFINEADGGDDVIRQKLTVIVK